MTAIAMPKDYAFDGLSRLIADANTITATSTLGGKSMSRMNFVSASANLTITLPAVSGWTNHLIWFRFDGLTSNALATIAGNGAENIIHGFKIANTRIYCKGEECCLYCDGTKWVVLHETLAEVYCHIYLNTNQVIPDSSGGTTVQFDTVVYDNGSFWDAVNYRFTPKAPGVYIAEACLTSTTTLVDQAHFGTYITRNGAVTSVGAYPHMRTGNNVTPHMHSTAQCSLNGSTDYVSVLCNQDNGGNMTLSASATNSYFHVHRITRETS